MAIQARKEACRKLREAKTVKQDEKRERSGKSKAVCEEADQKVEGDEEEHIEKDKRAGHTKLQALWSDLKRGHRSKNTSIPRLKCIGGKSLGTGGIG